MERVITMSHKELSRLEVMHKLQNRSLNQSQAADILNISTRQIKRLWRSFKGGGAKALISKKRGAPGNHRLPEGTKKRALGLILEKYSDFGPTLAHEKLSEIHNLSISLGSVRNLMISHEIWEPKKVRRKQVHQMRARRPREGELIQVDGSEHDWFEGRESKCTLLVYVDDATSALKELRFVKSESTISYFEATKSYLKKHGRPVAFYSDKHGVFRVNHKGALSGSGITQFGRAVQELDINMIYANSPQAKGRVERSNRTLQDRLIKELRLQNISTIQEANAYLPTFIEEYNRRFAVIAKNPANAHRPLLPTQNLEQIFTIKEERHLSKNLTLQYKNVIYQITPDRQSYALIGNKVLICEDQEGAVTILHKNKEMDYSTHHTQERQGEVIEAKRLDAEWSRLSQRSKKKKPSWNHPWKRGARRPIKLTV